MVSRVIRDALEARVIAPHDPTALRPQEREDEADRGAIGGGDEAGSCELLRAS